MPLLLSMLRRQAYTLAGTIKCGSPISINEERFAVDIAAIGRTKLADVQLCTSACLVVVLGDGGWGIACAGLVRQNGRLGNTLQGCS